MQVALQYESLLLWNNTWYSSLLRTPLHLSDRKDWRPIRNTPVRRYRGIKIATLFFCTEYLRRGIFVVILVGDVFLVVHVPLVDGTSVGLEEMPCVDRPTVKNTYIPIKGKILCYLEKCTSLSCNHTFVARHWARSLRGYCGLRGFPGNRTW